MGNDDEIVAARRAALRKWIKEEYGKPADFVRATGINQGELSGLLGGGKSFGEKKARKLEEQARMPKGYLERPGIVPAAAGAGPKIPIEQHAEGDVTALQIGLASLVLTVLQRTPGAASVFLETVDAMAHEQKFSMRRGLLGRLVNTARAVRQTEEAAAQALRLGGPAQRTRQGK